MSSTLELQQKVYLEIIGPSLNHEKVKAKGSELGFKSELSDEQVSTLHNALFTEISDKITAFMDSDEARKSCGNKHLFDGWEIQFHSAIRENLDPLIKEAFTIKAPPTLGEWLWSFFQSPSSEKNL